MFKTTKVCKGLMLAFGGSLLAATLPTATWAQRVEITGTSIKRVEAEGALQVQTLTRTDIDRTGAQNTEQLLATISAMSSSGGTNASMGASYSTYGLSSISLRGLGQDRTLVLLNGRRLAPDVGGSGGGAVNINNIPLAAIERVEILKDGASAIYGSDAVAGVVNFILNKNFQGVQIGGTYGSPTQSGGGQQYQANIVAGWGDITQDRFNLTVSGQYEKNKQLFAKDREFAKTGNKPPYFESGATGQGNIQGAWDEALQTGKTVGGLGYRGTSGSAYGNPRATPVDQCGTINMSLATSLSSGGQPFCNFDSAAFVGLTGETETAALSANFVFRLNEKAELFADGLYSKSTAISQIQPSPLRSSFLETDESFGTPGEPGSTGRALFMRPTNPNYAIASNYLQANGLGALDGETLGMTARVFDFGPRTSEDTNTLQRLVVGVRGEFMEQSYNVAVTSGRNKLDGKVTDGYFQQLGFVQATQLPNSDWNPWSLNQSPAFQAAIAPSKFTGATLTGETSLLNFDATISGDVVPMPAGTLQYAAGFQYRQDKFQQTPSSALSSGSIAGLGGAQKAIDEERSINAVFGELNIPIIKNLDLNLAARYDDYSDVGSTTNWKANVRWQPAQTLLLRGSYGTGFRAPTLTDLWNPQVLNTSSEFNDPVTGQDSLQVNETQGGNPDLSPETSTQYSLGLVFQPLPSLAIGLDYFNIQVDDAISQPSTQEIVSQNALGNPAYAGLVVRDPITNEIIETTALLKNNGKLEAKGMDIDVRYRERFGEGLLGIGLNGTYYFDFTQSTPGGSSAKVATIVNPDGSPVISSTANQDAGVILRYKQYFSVNWTQGDWSTTLGNNYASGYRAGNDLDGNETRVDPLSLWDLQVSYSGIKNAVITLGARNIFDTVPSIFVPAAQQFQAGYDPTQYDPRGRFVFLTGTLRF